MIYLVTGTGSKVGKTAVCAELARMCVAHGAQVAVVKLVQVGGQTPDMDFVQAHVPEAFTATLATYPEPLTPIMAASRAGKPALCLPDVVGYLQVLEEKYGCVIVEGIGSLVVKIGHGWTLADLAKAVHGHLILVTDLSTSFLGLAELQISAAAKRGLKIVGLIGGTGVKTADLVNTLQLGEFEHLTKIPYLGSVPDANGPGDIVIPKDCCYLTLELPAFLAKQQNRHQEQ